MEWCACGSGSETPACVSPPRQRLAHSGAFVVADLRRQFYRGLLDESVHQIGSDDSGGPSQRKYAEFATKG